MNVGGAQLRTVLARLLVDAGRRVSVSALVDELWAQRAPADAERTARTYVSRLRAALGRAPSPAAASRDPGPLLTHPGGYELNIDPSTVNAVRFERLVASGRRALAQGQPRLAQIQLTEALTLWQGDAYVEFDECPVVSAEGVRLNGVRLGVVEDRIAATSASEPTADLVDELQGLVRAYPLRERLCGLLMVALYRSGRQAEALAAYRNARTVLVETHGVEPSPELNELHQRILQQDSSLLPASGRATPAEVLAATGLAATGLAATGLAATGTAATRSHPMPAPSQLPSAIRTLVGRVAELARLDAVLAADPPDGSSVTICAITGTAGVGKTSLAISWAHRVSSRFPDGQLYANLGGFANEAVVDAGAVLQGFLEAFGLPPEWIPAGLDARAALFRSVLAGKRVLVVLDNARDAHHVRPLLPGTPGSMLVVTSRTSLAGLAATEGAHHVRLDVLSRGEARELLAGRLGWDRVGAAPAEIDEIIARCARLPLALAIASARPGAAPGGIMAEQRATDVGLDAFELGDDAASVRAALSWSYRLLSEPSARLFRLIGCQPGTAVSTDDAARMTRLSHGEARQCLRELLFANMLTEPAPGQYTCHRLLRAYACECAGPEDWRAARAAAVTAARA